MVLSAQNIEYGGVNNLSFSNSKVHRRTEHCIVLERNQVNTRQQYLSKSLNNIILKSPKWSFVLIMLTYSK